jgi:curved DNA-binding protein CbpA
VITYYELLGVPCDASQSSIKAAFRKNIKIYHPDVNRAENAEWITRALTAACAMLSDAVQRAEYDRALARVEDLKNPAAAEARQADSPFDARSEAQRAAEVQRAERARRAEERHTAKREYRAARDKAAQDAQRERELYKRLAWEAAQHKEQQRKESARRAAEAARIERNRLFWTEEQRKEDARLRKSQPRTGDRIRHYHTANSTLFGSVFKIVHIFQANVHNPQTCRLTWEAMSVAVDANGFYIFVDSARDVVTRSGPVKELNTIARETPGLSELLADKTPLY